MPLLYGEGVKAFVRLQEEIIKVSVDHTIFCWSWNDEVPTSWNSLIAPSPDTFKHSRDFYPKGAEERASPYAMTNVGLSIRLPVIRAWSYSFIVLMVRHYSSYLYVHKRVCIPVKSLLRPTSTSDSVSTYRRISVPPDPIFLPNDWATAEIDMFVVSRMMDSLSTISKPKPRSLLIAIRESLYSPRPLTRSQFNRYGEELHLRMAKKPPIYHTQTLPVGLFDEATSLFSLTHRFEKGWNGLLALGDEDFGCVIFISCKYDNLRVMRNRWFCDVLPFAFWLRDDAEKWRLLRFLESRVTSMKGQSEKRAAVCPEVGGYFVIDGNDAMDNEDGSWIVAASLQLGLKRERIEELSKDIEKPLLLDFVENH